MNICQLFVEPRVSLIAIEGIDSERKILLKKTDRWPGFLTVPGEAIRHSDPQEETLEKLLEREGLTAISKPKFLGMEPSIHSKQFYLENAHLIFLEYEVEVSGKPKNGELYKLYWVLANSSFYYEHKDEGYNRELVVEEVTYRTLMKYEKNGSSKIT